MRGEALLQARDVSKAYAGVQALRSATFDLRPGEIHALVGENGAGKSTLIRILSGATQPDGGSIVIVGEEVTDHSPSAAKRHGIACIYQQPAHFPELTVAENLAVGVERPGRFGIVDWKARRERAARMLARVGATIDPTTTVAELSMPQQQLVEIARALGADARILILDEPTASLTEKDAQHLLAVLRRLRAGGVGMIYISHRLEELSAIADRVTVLRDGETIGTRAMSAVSRAQLIEMMVGRSLSSIYPVRDAIIGEPVLQLREFGCSASGVHGVTLTVRAGEILGVAGLVGAGRTELARAIFGLTPSDAGEMLLEGTRVHAESSSRAISHGVAYVPEDRRKHGVVPEMAISDNITLASLDRCSPSGALGALGALDGDRERAIAVEYVSKLQVRTPSTFNAVGILSGGNQQKVALARWLATDPRLLILDEPTQGVDVGAKAEIHAIISTLAERGVAIILISSELPEILGMSDRIVVMREGTIVRTFDRVDATPALLLEAALGDTPKVASFA